MKRFLKLFGCGLCCLLGSLMKCKAQNTTYRPKIAEFSLRTLSDHHTASTSEAFGDASSKTDQDRLLKLKLGVPIIMKGKAMFGTQLKYYRHHFGFGENDFAPEYELYNYLHERTFTSLGIRFLYKYKWDDKRCLTLMGGGEMQSDRLVWNANTTRYFISGHYKKQTNATTTVGFGVVANYALKVPGLYPLFSYEKVLAPKWTLDLLLPKSAAIRHQVNDKTFLIAQTSLTGWRYNLTAPIEYDNRDFMLRRTDAQFQLKLERELHDWLWCGVEMGYNKNINYYLSNHGDRRRDALIDLTARDAHYGKVSIFLVPPKKFYK